MNFSDQIFVYLKSKINNFEQAKIKGELIFTCPNLANHKYVGKSPTAKVINGSDKITCLQCGYKGTFYDVVRLLEIDKRDQTDSQITAYLMSCLNVDVYSELKQYKKYDWALVPIAKNSKNPIERDWTNIEHREEVDWIKWLNSGLNIGVRTGSVSGITVVDVDLKVPPAEELTDVYNALKDCGTLTQNTPHGLHYIFKYDKDITQTVDIGGFKIDIRNDGGQIIVQPSHLDSLCYRWLNLGEEIKDIPKEIKDKLISLMGNKRSESGRVNNIKLDGEDGVIKEGEGRNSKLISMGGVLINKFDIEETAYIMNMISRNFFNPPLPDFEIKAMLGSLDKYKTNEESTIENAIYEYLKLMQNDVSAKDVMESLKLSRAIVDKYLSQFCQAGKAIRLSRGRYKYREKVEWSDSVTERTNLYEYKMPYFNEVMHFEHGDIILIGGKTSNGKTTVALNIVKGMVDQGVKPFYIYSESGSRHQKIAKSLNLLDGDSMKFYKSYHGNPLSIEIEESSFTVLDWLMISEKENTDSVYKYLTEEMQRKGGILVVMMQLKENYEYFAPNMVTQFPAFAARYIFDSEDGRVGHFQIDKIRDPIGNYRNSTIPCEYNFETRILRKKDSI